MRIGILGGTFNPIHNGHIYMGKCALKELALDKIMILPSGCSYMKDQSNILPGEIRYHMAQLACMEEENFFVSDFELTFEGPTYTSVTFQNLLALHPDWEIYFIVGADTAFSIEKWKAPDIIMKLSKLVVLFRNDGIITKEDLVNQCNKLSSSFGATVHILDAEPLDISSTNLREKLKKHEDVSEYLPGKLIEYIKSNGFYGA